jgi:hypothetical protein
MPRVSFPPGHAESVPTPLPPQPDRALGWVCWAIIAFSATQILLFGFGRDHAAHALVGEALLRGEAPYLDAWDSSAPGIFFIHALTQTVLGKSMLALRLVEVLGLLSLVLSSRWLGGHLFGSRTAGLVGGALASLLHAQLDYWHTAQPETFAGFLTAGALVVTTRAVPRLVRQCALLGLLSGLTLLLAPLLAGFIAVCGTHLLRRIQLTRGSHAVLAPGVLLLGAFALPGLLCFLWLWSKGAWQEAWWTLTSYATRQAEESWAGRAAVALFYDASLEAVAGFSALTSVGLAAALLLPPTYPRERESLHLLFGVASAQLAAIALGGSVLPHRFGAVLPVLSLASGVGWYKVWRRMLPNGPLGVVAFASIVFVVGAMRDAGHLPDTFWQRSALRTGYLLRIGTLPSREALDQALATPQGEEPQILREVAQELSRALPPEALHAQPEALHVQIDEPRLYWLSSARPASRFLRGDPKAPLAPPAWATELEAALEQRLPTYLVTRAQVDDSTERPWLNAHYEQVRTIGDLVVYGRRSPTATGPGTPRTTPP